jgi:hypothetical protein
MKRMKRPREQGLREKKDEEADRARGRGGEELSQPQ